MTVHDNTAATEHVTREPLHTRQITFEGSGEATVYLKSRAI